MATKKDIPSDEVEVINQAILRDDQVDINLDTPPGQSIENEKYHQLTAKDIPLEDLTDTNADTRTVDQPVIKLEILLDIDEDTLLDTDMDDANTFVPQETTSVTTQNPPDENDLGELFLQVFFLSKRLYLILVNSPMLKISAIKQKIVVVSPGKKAANIGDTSFEQELPLKCLPKTFGMWLI